MKDQTKIKFERRIAAPDESATVSDSMGRVAQNEAPAHGFSGGRAVQGAMSHAPDVAAQSGRDYDQETLSTISTNEEALDMPDGPIQAPSRSGSAATFRGASNTGSTVPAVRPESGNSSTTLSEARQSRRTGTAVPELRRAAHSPAPVRTSGPRNFDEVRDFAEAQGLDYDDTRLWWQRNFVERDGVDKDGNPIKNWKGALVNACKAEEIKRRSA